jgi:heptosyltransferase I
LPDLKNIAIIRMSSLGDIVHTLPAFQLLRERFPEAYISWFVEPAGAALLENFSGISEIVVVDLKQRGFLGKISSLAALRRVYRGRFDLIIDFQGLLKSSFLGFVLGGERLGFHRRNLRESLSAIFYDRTPPYFSEDRHVIFKNIHLLSLLGIVGEDLVYPFRKPAPSVLLQNFFQAAELADGKWVVINIGGGWPSKVLQPEQLEDLTRRLASRFRVVLLWGNAAEGREAARIAGKTGAVLPPLLNFGDLIFLLGCCTLLISADTLALHLADMAGTPSIGIFGPTSPVRNGSLLPKSVAIREKLECQFCYRRKCDTMECIRRIDLNEVVRIAERMYNERS